MWVIKNNIKQRKYIHSDYLERLSGVLFYQISSVSSFHCINICSGCRMSQGPSARRFGVDVCGSASASSRSCRGWSAVLFISYTGQVPGAGSIFVQYFSVREDCVTEDLCVLVCTVSGCMLLQFDVLLCWAVHLIVAALGWSHTHVKCVHLGARYGEVREIEEI